MHPLALTANQWDALINAVGLVGIVLLAIPAFHASKYGRLLAKIGTIKPDSSALMQKRKQLIEDLHALQDNWTPWKGNALIWGTILTGLSNLLGLIKAVVM